MEFSDKITVILLLKGRHSYTQRWLEYHSRLKIPFPILVGDGAPSSEIEEVVNHYSESNKLDIKYLKYNDETYFDFYRKIADLISRANTPYVQLCDNDDFVFPCGWERTIEFLDRHPDYSTGGDGKASFCVRSDDEDNRNGEWYNLTATHPFGPMHISQDTAKERVLATLPKLLSSYNSVQRKEQIYAAFNTLAKSGIHELVLGEIFVTLYSAVLGKHNRMYHSVSYLYQRGTPRVHQYPPFLERVFEGTFVKDVNLISMEISKAISEQDQIDTEGLRKKILVLLYERFHSLMKNQEMTFSRKILDILRDIKHSRSKIVPALNDLFSTPRMKQEQNIKRMIGHLRQNSEQEVSELDITNQFEIFSEVIRGSD